jgi:2-methylcitrate dehydratase PrpD
VAETLASRLASFAVGLEASAIPADVRQAARLHLLDTLGCGLAAHGLSVSTAGQAIAGTTEAGGATVIGRQGPASDRDAALANGMLCHGLDFDDTHSDSIAHVSVVACAAALAAAETAGASGRELLAAIVVANEVTTRVGAAAAAGYMVRGFHPTSVSGVFGATAAAARLLDLDRATTTRALGIAGSMAAGIFAYLSDGSLTKPVHAGWAASAGVTAARLARAGGEGPGAVFEDRFGFYAAYYGEGADRLERSLATLGSAWETPRIACKAYPACHFVHGCLDAAQRAHRETGWEPAEISRIDVAVPVPGIPLVLEPLAGKRRPRTDYDGKFSLPYSVAAMLVHGRVDLQTYADDALADPVVLALADTVQYRRRSFDTFPRAFPGWLRVRNVHGFVFESETPVQRGAPDNPLSEEDVLLKFHQNATLAVDAAAASLVDTVRGLEELDDVRGAFRALEAA